MYSLPCIDLVIKRRRLRYAGHVARMGEGRSAFKILTDTPTRKIHLWRRRWEYNIRIDLKEIGFNRRSCGDSTQDRDCWRGIYKVNGGTEPPGFISLGISLLYLNIWKHTPFFILQNTLLHWFYSLKQFKCSSRFVKSIKIFLIKRDNAK